MSIRLNEVFVGGGVGRDPEVRQTGSGKKVANFSMAIDSGRPDQPIWYNIVAWEKLADVVEKYVTKGSLLVVKGKLDVKAWEKDGVKRYDHFIVATGINLVGGTKKEETSSTGGGGYIDDNDIPF